MDDVDCPYCGKGQEINHDDGYGYAEDRKHDQECGDCQKTFIFTTSISYYYEAEKADCLNGSPHRLSFSKSYPEKYSAMVCADCELRRKPTDEEFTAAGIILTPTPTEEK